MLGDANGRDDVIDADHVELAAGWKFPYIPVQQHHRNAILYEFVGNVAIPQLAIGDRLDGREQYAVDMLLDKLSAESKGILS
jgi:hypothetical protein